MVPFKVIIFCVHQKSKMGMHACAAPQNKDFLGPYGQSIFKTTEPFRGNLTGMFLRWYSEMYVVFVK
jgi:hypothetical protein